MNAPRSLGPYRLLERIGVGGMAEVFRARRLGASGFHKELAIKVLLPELAHEPEAQRRLIAEARLGAAMSHRNLVSVFDLGVDDGRHYVVMELVAGGDLGTRRAGAPLPEPLALFVAIEIAAALAYVHAFTDEDGRALGLVHRDVSPANVLVSDSGEVKLADYGIAKATGLAQQTDARIVPGKFSYLSPEQLAGDGASDRSDQFSLGITLAELVSGRRPFDAGSPAATMDRIRSGEADLSALPDDLQPIVSRCLATEPADRYADLPALVDALQPACRAREPVTVLDLARWCRRASPPAG